ncbi:MAG: Holliday junction branch migration protein RuvA, partial [Candidatus Competibacterales bacterium]|nr:Holliday junction branch migration protein RuvA [Candidatus Competibacterales bacterium]
TFAELPATGGEVTLHTHLIVREDAHQLYGFATLSERTLFRDLIRVSGVGAKLALLILSGMTPDTFARCVRDGDTAALVRLPGIGKKSAERLVVEMRDRIGRAESGNRMAVSPVAAPDRVDAVGDAVSALVALGYKPADAERMVRAIDCTDLASEAIIRQALRAAVKS